jgi:hypothetical protein
MYSWVVMGKEAKKKSGGAASNELEDLAKQSNYSSSSGFAHSRISIRPVFGQRISCHDTGSVVAPPSLVANITPKRRKSQVLPIQNSNNNNVFMHQAL